MPCDFLRIVKIDCKCEIKCHVGYREVSSCFQEVLILISVHWFHFQVKPSELSSPENFTSFLTAQDSLFNRLIRNGDLNKATELANTLLEAIAKDSPLSLAEKTKVM